jgi:UDP-N-acetyl-D-mannosaminuronic acid dehydrogenase
MTVRPEIASTATAATVANADITVVGGAGHVGIPLVLALAESGLRVNVNDLNRQILDTLAAGRVPFIERGAEEVLARAIAHKRLVFTDRPNQISSNGPVIITIGTPIDEFLNPVRRVVQDCIDALLPALNDGQLIILRSTVFPGTTDWLASYLQDRGRKLKIAFCPERVVQGNGLVELREMPQIVSGTTPEAEAEAAAVFERIAPEVIRISPIEAEFAKLFANAYRYIEFAATNEFYLIAKSAGVDYHRVLSAMKSNYPRLRAIPGPGYAAGPCLVKDTMQLSAFASNQFGLGHAALLVNEGLVLRVVEDIKRRFDLPTIAVGLLGMAFKAESEGARRPMQNAADHGPVRQPGARPRPAATGESHRRQRPHDPVRAARGVSQRGFSGQARVRCLGPVAGRVDYQIA